MGKQAAETRVVAPAALSAAAMGGWLVTGAGAGMVAGRKVLVVRLGLSARTAEERAKDCKEEDWVALAGWVAAVAAVAPLAERAVAAAKVVEVAGLAAPGGSVASATAVVVPEVVAETEVAEYSEVGRVPHCK